MDYLPCSYKIVFGHNYTERQNMEKNSRYNFWMAKIKDLVQIQSIS